MEDFLLYLSIAFLALLSIKILIVGYKHFHHWQQTKKMKALIEQIDKLYQGINAFSLSKTYRQKMGIQDQDFTYGEWPLLSLMELFDIANIQPQECFYDLGSGAGQSVLCAQLWCRPKASIGVELIPVLQETAKNRLEALKSQQPSLVEELNKIEFINSDFKEQDLSQADVILINATAFSSKTWESLADKLLSLKKGARIIICSKQIKHEQFEMIYAAQEHLSWGINSVRIYRKVK